MKNSFYYGSNSISLFSTVSDSDTVASPSNNSTSSLESDKPQKKKQSRFRQHVNPLSRKFQVPVDLDQEWPLSVYDNPDLPLHLDIGCGKGGFLLDLASSESIAKPSSFVSSFASQRNDCAVEVPPTAMNYLGLEIRPSVAEYANSRISTWDLQGRLCFLSSNANVDLDRILNRFKEKTRSSLERITIQYPDPHFKKSHAKRRVVTPELVCTLAKYTNENAEVLLQSDVQSVLDEMRVVFREHTEYFVDEMDSAEEYLENNPIGIPTEREVSVLEKGLPVYRALFRRNGSPGP